jgi:hypothetical protein
LVDGGFLVRGDFILLTMNSSHSQTRKTDMLKILPVD